MDYVYKVYCEWDIGLNETVFMTAEGAWAAAEQAIEEGGFDSTMEELKDENLVGVELWSICE